MLYLWWNKVDATTVVMSNTTPPESPSTSGDDDEGGVFVAANVPGDDCENSPTVHF